LLVSGDLNTHSQAIQDTHAQIAGKPDAKPLDIALIYGRSIQAINLRNAEAVILAPLGLNTDTFNVQQRDLSEGYVDTLRRQLQEFRGPDVEAIIAGSDGKEVHLYTIDHMGVVNCLDDTGFAAIGIGAWHARSRLMQIGYTNTRIFAPALASIFAAKKTAEIAPGVGEATDIHVILRDSISPLWDPAGAKLVELYSRYESERLALEGRIAAELQTFLDTPNPEGKPNVATEGQAGGHPQHNESAGPDAAEAARGNEGGKESGD